MKEQAKALLRWLKLDLTKGIQYERLMHLVLKKALKEDSNCIDIGSRKGEVLSEIIKLSPKGKHYAFEPIPELYDELKDNYAFNCAIFPCLLSDTEGTTTVNYFKNSSKNVSEINENSEIEIEVKCLDNLVPKSVKISLMKVVVADTAFNVLKGAKSILVRDKPLVIFECGLEAGDFYTTNPYELFQFLESCGLKVSFLKSWLKEEPELTDKDFLKAYKTNSEYYFVAHS